jgi:hypothetical protein
MSNPISQKRTPPSAKTKIAKKAIGKPSRGAVGTAASLVGKRPMPQLGVSRQPVQKPINALMGNKERQNALQPPAKTRDRIAPLGPVLWGERGMKRGGNRAAHGGIIFAERGKKKDKAMHGGTTVPAPSKPAVKQVKMSPKDKAAMDAKQLADRKAQKKALAGE